MKERFPSRINTLRRHAWRVLHIEQLVHGLRLWCLVPILWGGSALFHLPQSLPDGVHALLELSLLVLCLWGMRRAIKKLPPITTRQIDARIEHDSHASFQPLLTLSDVPARPSSSPHHDAGEDGTQFLWSLHQHRTLEKIDQFRVGLPRLFPQWRDTIGALLLVIGIGGGVVISGSHTIERLRAGILPGTDDDSVALPQVQAWIAPPVYAPMPPLFLSIDHPFSSGPLAEGAMLHLVVTGSQTAPSLRGIRNPHYHHLSPRSWQIDAPIQHSGTVTLRVRGRTLASWPLKVTPNQPPTLQWTGTPAIQSDGWNTIFPWKAQQTYGLASVEVELSLPPSRHAHHKARVAHIPLPLNDHSSEAHDRTERDLSDDPFAGMVVDGRLHARSISGQESTSAPRRFRIGARPFTDPLARALVTLRQRLALGDETRQGIQRDLSLLGHLSLPRDIHLPLLAIIAHITDDSDIPSLQERLWFLALYIEDRQHNGVIMAASMAELWAAQQDVALQIDKMAAASSSSLEEQTDLHQRLERLQHALNARLSLMIQKANQSGIVMPMPNGKNAPWVKLAQTIQKDTLDHHIDHAHEALRQMVAMAEHIRQATLSDLQSLAQQMKAQSEMRAQKRALRDLIKQETRLLNETQSRFAEAQQTTPPSEDHDDIGNMSTSELLHQLGMEPSHEALPSTPLNPNILQEQSPQRQHNHATQRALQTLDHILLRRSQEIAPQPFKGLQKADHDMTTVLHTLAQQHDHDAAGAEQKVLDDLAQARKEMQQNQRASQQQGGLGFIPPPSPQSGSDGHSQGEGQDQHNGTEGQPQDFGDDPSDQDQDQDQGNDSHDQGDDSPSQQKDPLGRQLDNGPSSDAHIPKNDHNRRQAIERELQRRASDRTRPQSELDYLNRLLAPLHPTP